MAFSKTANALVEEPNIGLSGWNNLRTASLLNKNAEFARSRTASISIENYSPDKYLLTHCTIIASVDVDEVKNAKTGATVREGGNTINRPYTDYHITPDTTKYINQNNDAWERKLLLASYDTFVGAENYVEHIQIPELSKGKVIDAVARDLGDTVYVDILVATDRSHKDLVAKIEAGKLNTLSMGCTIDFSVCTKCGNLATDETNLCHHIKHQKGQKFVDKEGSIRVIAELCGHHTDPDSVRFIEASWVANPAFKGAVMRNILEWSQAETKEPTKYEVDALRDRIENAYTASADPNLPDWSEYFVKVARSEAGSFHSRLDTAITTAFYKTSFGFDDDEEEDDKDKDKGDENSLVDDAIEEFKDRVKDKAIDDLKKDLRRRPEEDDDDEKSKPEAEGQPNDTIIQSYRLFRDRYAVQLRGSDRIRYVFAAFQTLSSTERFMQCKDRFENRDIVTAMYLYDRDSKEDTLPDDLYHCLRKVGSTSNYDNLRGFLRACLQTVGRKLSKEEAEILVKRAKLLN